MKFKYLFLFPFLIITNQVHAYFLMQDMCDSKETFSVSSEEACETICPGRYAKRDGGSSFFNIDCNPNFDKNEDGAYSLEEDPCYDIGEEIKPNCENNACEEKNKQIFQKHKECLKDAIKKGVQKISFGYYDDPDIKLLEKICNENKNYTTKIYGSSTTYCVRKCPKNVPVMGMEDDCYSCGVDYPIHLSNCTDYVMKDSEFENPCPNRVVIGSTSYKNIIDSCNTIEKVKKLIKEGKYYNDASSKKVFGPYSLLEWNVMFNHDENVIKYLLKNDPYGFNVHVLRHAIDKKAPESIMKILLDYAKENDLKILMPHGILYDVTLDNGEWEIPLSFYAKYAGASEKIQNLIKTYEKKFGIDFEPKIWEDKDEEIIKEGK